MAGLKLDARLKEMGIYAGRSDSNKVWAEDLYLHDKDHKLHHPRADRPLVESLVLDIMANGVKDPVLVRLEHDKLMVCDGSRRVRHAQEAQARLRKAKDEKVLKKDDNDGKWKLPIKIELLPGNTTDAQFLIERQTRDRQPLKEHHDVEVLAVSVCQLLALEVSVEVILNILPRDWSKLHIEAVNLHWHSMPHDLIEQFNSGTAPVGLLPAILNAKPADRKALLAALIEAGMSSPKGATRFINREKADAALNDGDEHITDADIIESAPATPGAAPATPAGTTAATGATPAGNKPAGDKPPREKSRQAVAEKIVRRAARVAKERPKVDSKEIAFYIGAEAALGDPLAVKTLIDDAKKFGASEEVLAVLAGVCWRMGFGGSLVEKITPTKAIESIEAGSAKTAAAAKAKTKAAEATAPAAATDEKPKNKGGRPKKNATPAVAA